FVATQPQSLIIYFAPMLGIYVIVSFVIYKSAIFSLSLLKKTSIIVVVAILCNLFWIVPAIQLVDSRAISADDQGNGIVEENVDQLSRRSTLLNVVKGTSPWIWGGGSTPDFSIKVNNMELWD